MSGHDHDDGHGHSHAHESGGPVRRLIASVFRPHSHAVSDQIDATLASSSRGIWAVKVSLVGLMVTALLQVFIVWLTGSVALLSDTIHNFADALTAVPLWIAFSYARRARTRRFTHGFGKLEDIAGAVIVLVIASSAFLAMWESFRRLGGDREVSYVGWLIAAGIIGFLGNEGVAIFRIRVGKEIGSAALVADGYHARTDGITSLGVVAAGVGAAAGFPIIDPIVGIAIGIAILFIVYQAGRDVWYRLLDAVEPGVVEHLEETARQPGVLDVDRVQVRWVGHRLQAQLHIVVDGSLTTRASHDIAESVRHALFHAEPNLSSVTVHIDPSHEGGPDPHIATLHHRTVT